MIVSRNLTENLSRIKNLIRLERNLSVDLVDVEGVSGFFVSRKAIDADVIKFINRYFGEIKGFENTAFFQTLSPVKKLELKKSSQIEDINVFLNENKSVLVINGLPHLYGIGIDNKHISPAYNGINDFLS